MVALPVERIGDGPPRYLPTSETKLGRNIERWRYQIFKMGFDQMRNLWESEGTREYYPLLWVGGRKGFWKIASMQSYSTMHDMAHAWSEARLSLRRALENEEPMTAFVHDWRVGPGYQEVEVMPHPFDLAVFDTMIGGGLEASRYYADSAWAVKVAATNAASYLESLLQDQGFSDIRHGDFIVSDAPDRPPEQAILGVVMVLHVTTQERRYIYVARETMAKSRFDKQPGDYGPPAGGREDGEPLRVTAYRELREETRLTPAQVVISRRPIGFFQFENGNGQADNSWIAALDAEIDEYTLWTHAIHPMDGETHRPVWIPAGTYLGQYPLRGAMFGIIKAWDQGQVDVVETATPGRHEGVIEVNSFGKRAFVTTL